MRGLPFKIKDSKRNTTSSSLVLKHAIHPLRIVGEGKMKVNDIPRLVYFVACRHHYASTSIIIPGTYKSHSGLPLSAYGKNKPIGLVAIYPSYVDLLNNISAAGQLVRFED